MWGNRPKTKGGGDWADSKSKSAIVPGWKYISSDMTIVEAPGSILKSRSGLLLASAEVHKGQGRNDEKC